MVHEDFEVSRMRECDAIDPDMQDSLQCSDCGEYWTQENLPGKDEEECPDCGSTALVEVEKEYEEE